MKIIILIQNKKNLINVLIFIYYHIYKVYQSLDAPVSSFSKLFSIFIKFKSEKQASPITQE